MAENAPTRVILLNRLVSTSTSRAPQEHHPPTVAGSELIQILDHRREGNLAIEFLGATDDDDEKKRLANGKGHSFIRLSRLKVKDAEDFTYATLLIEYVDETVRSLPVVHTETYEGREIAGDPSEYGSSTTHVVVRLPKGGYDDGSYRCAIESGTSITRNMIETFLSRQLRRHAKANAFTFSVVVQGKRKKKPESKSYRYYPRLDLIADVGRGINLPGGQGSVLSHMIFTKRSEKTNIHGGTDVLHKEVIADVDIRVTAKQGPEDPEERKGWLAGVRSYFEGRGYESRLYYRHLGGSVVSGEVHHAVAGAADIFMCPKDIIELDDRPKRWQREINDEIAQKMTELVDKDALWERSK
jgi:hypothetical protein